MPKISVVMATLNAERFVTTFSTRYIQQTRSLEREVELIVVDGGSTDNTTQALSSAVPAATIVRKPASGIYAAWNHGVRLSTGTWIMFYGADDLIGPDWLQAVASIHSSPDLVYGNLELFDADGFSIKVRSNPPEQALPGLATRLTVPHVGLAHHRSLFETAGFDETFHIVGDYDFLRRAHPKSAIYLSHCIQAQMRLGGVSNTAASVRAAWAEHLRISPRPPLVERIRWFIRITAARMPCLFHFMQRRWHQLRALWAMLRARVPIAPPNDSP